MKESRLDRPDIRTRVVQDLVSGKSQAEIAREVGISRSQVNRFANREDIVEECETQWKRLMDVMEDAVGNLVALVREMKSIPKEDSKNRELAYKATVKVLESGGLLSTGTPSQVMVNVINQNQVSGIPPEIDALLKARQTDLQETGKEFEESMG